MPQQRSVMLGSVDLEAGDVVDAVGLTRRFDAIRAELEVPEEFPPEVLAEAEQVAAQPLSLPERDETDLPFITIDPPGSMDLDQAMYLSREGDGYRVRYAIAHLESFVAPGGTIDAEARRRGQTIYAPNMRTPLHPPVLSEGAASLLPDEIRPAYVWDIGLDASGKHTTAEVYPALVKSVERLAYAAVQEAVDGGTAAEHLVLLREIGEKRIALEQQRGGVALPMPDQEVSGTEGGFRLHLRPLVPAEDWNAQISLLTGMVAAEMMLRAEVGILRMMPEPSPKTLDQLRRIASALGIDWPRNARGAAAFPRRGERQAPRAHPRVDDPLSGSGIHRLRRRATGGRRAVCDRGSLRPRDRAAAPPRRPLRARPVCRRERGGRGAVVGA